MITKTTISTITQKYGLELYPRFWIFIYYGSWKWMTSQEGAGGLLMGLGNESIMTSKAVAGGRLIGLGTGDSAITTTQVSVGGGGGVGDTAFRFFI